MNEGKKIATVKVAGVIIRLARKNNSEIQQIAELEREVWEDEAADADKIRSRIKVFPQGNYVAENEADKKIVGYVSFQYLSDLRQSDKSEGKNWFDITDGGFIRNSHQPNGEYMYGVDLSVHYSASKKNLGFLLVSQCYLHMLATKKRGVFLGSRIPMFKSYRKYHSDVTVSDYVKLRRGKRLYDYELNLYYGVLLNPEIVKILPDFFPDEKSLNYGVLLFDKNVFYDCDDKKIKKLIKIIVNQEFFKLREEMR